MDLVSDRSSGSPDFKKNSQNKSHDKEGDDNGDFPPEITPKGTTAMTTDGLHGRRHLTALGARAPDSRGVTATRRA